MAALQPRITQSQTMKVAGLRKHQLFGETMSSGLAAQWREFAPLMPAVPHATGRTAYGLCFEDKDKSGFDYVTAVEVAGYDQLSPPLSGATIPAGTYAAFAHRGHVSTLSDTVQQAWDWLPTSGRRHAHASGEALAFIERYGTAFDPQTGFGDIEVWIPVSG